VNAARIGTLIGKELREFRSNPAAIIPVVLLVGVCVALPVFLLVVLPAATGRPLAADRDIARVVNRVADRVPGLAGLTPDAAVEAFLFQQFLMMFLIAPIVGAVSLAAYSVVGEKQGRTLEPLLTTPLTTAELLIAKVLASFLPSLVIEGVGVGIYLALVGAFAHPGVAGTLLTFRSAVLLLFIGPLASLAALQATIAVSSRVNDARSAQQIAVIIVLPLVGILVGQIGGAFIVPTWVLSVVAIVLAAIWGLLILFSVALFDRERILTRWK
jgi:ABC-2 type transport system permease protein